MAPDIDNKNGVDMGNIASINGQDAPSGGGSATATPSLSISGGGFGVVTATITKSGGGTYTNPNYQVITTLADGTVTVTDANVDRLLESDSSHLSGTLTLTDTNASAAERTVTVKAQEFGDTIQSSAATATFTPSYLQKEYIRVTACDSSGNATASNMGIREIRFYTGTEQSGTAYPTTNLTSATSETDIAVTVGHVYSASYDGWLAADNAPSGSFYWALAASAANNWWQIQFQDGTYDTKPVIKSIAIRFFGTYHGTHVKVTGSDNADHSSATTIGIFTAVDGPTMTNIG